MIANRLFLLGNALVLLLVVGQRSSLPGGGLETLPWSTFGTELQAIVTEATLSSAALLCLWILLTSGWLVLTLIIERRHRIETAARAKNLKEASDRSEHDSPNLRMDGSPGPHNSSAPADLESNPSANPSDRTWQTHHSEPSLGGSSAQGAGPQSTQPTEGHADNGEDSGYRGQPSSANASDISGVLAGVKERNKSLSPEARAEIARLQAALQTLSDQAADEAKKDDATPSASAS
ncbi:MAG: hypothetical protein RLY67_1064 [Pseudomonadota bacterium]